MSKRVRVTIAALAFSAVALVSIFKGYYKIKAAGLKKKRDLALRIIEERMHVRNH